MYPKRTITREDWMTDEIHDLNVQAVAIIEIATDLLKAGHPDACQSCIESATKIMQCLPERGSIPALNRDGGEHQ